MEAEATKLTFSQGSLNKSLLVNTISSLNI